MERRTTATAGGSRACRRQLERDTTASNEWGDRYTPGKVVNGIGSDEYFVPLLFVSALADSAFWDRHCFVARGVESRDGRRLIRLDFSPALDVRDPDWEGSAWLDSARSVLARVDFRLTNLRNAAGPQQFQGYTVFSTPTPYIAMPDSTVACVDAERAVRGRTGSSDGLGRGRALVIGTWRTGGEAADGRACESVNGER